MSLIQKARLTFLGIDDELKNDTNSIYTTQINSSFFPVPAVLDPALAPAVDGVQYGFEAVNFTTRLNTKRYKYTIGGSLKNLNLTKNAKIIIESICIPNVISQTFLQSKCVNNVILKLKGINNNFIWDS